MAPARKVPINVVDARHRPTSGGSVRAARWIARTFGLGAVARILLESRTRRRGTCVCAVAPLVAIRGHHAGTRVAPAGVDAGASVEVAARVRRRPANLLHARVAQIVERCPRVTRVVGTDWWWRCSSSCPGVGGAALAAATAACEQQCESENQFRTVRHLHPRPGLHLVAHLCPP
jgi:hypothetical protein